MVSAWLGLIRLLQFTWCRLYMYIQEQYGRWCQVYLCVICTLYVQFSGGVGKCGSKQLSPVIHSVSVWLDLAGHRFTSWSAVFQSYKMGKSGRCRFLESWNLWTCLLGSLYCSDLSFGVVGCKNAEKGCISIREYSKIYEKVISQVVQTPQQPVFQSKDGDAGMYKLWIRFWNNASLLYWSLTCVCIILPSTNIYDHSFE